jgi:hypothetical protein
MNRERPPNPLTKNPRINPMDREPGAVSSRPRLSPTKALALRTTTLANTFQPDLRATLAARFGPPPHAATLVRQRLCLTPGAAGHA